MRILLITPNLCRDPYPVYPLGMSVIAGALTRAGHTVRQFDALVHGPETLPQTIRTFHPDLIGFSIRNLDTVNSRSPEKGFLDTALRMIACCRKETDVPILLGGSGYSLLPETILRLSGADWGIAGEGEEAILELVAELERGEKREPKIRMGRPGPQSGAVYPEDLLAFYREETHILPIQTKRGCPYHCAYCTYPALEGRTIRERGNDDVLDQLEELARNHSDTMFYFVDATFNDPAGEFRTFLKRMRERRLTLPFAAFLTPSHLTESDITLMRTCGMIAAELGIDASTDETLRGLGKTFSFHDAAEKATRLLKSGIGVTTNVMFGGPGETAETVRAGIRNLRSLEPVHTLVFSGIRLFPNTPLYETARREGKIPEGWDGIRELYYFADGLDPEQLHETLVAGFRDSRFCIYPPDARNGELRLLHKLGYARLRRISAGGEDA